MRGKYILSTILVAVAVIGVLAYLYGGSQSPPGQAPLERLTAQNVAEVGNAFNAAKGDIRLLLLLSPT